MYKYRFSIITCIYKIEDYLEEAIQSIINQDIGFEENIQYILVNDGSPDNCEEICLKYQKQYPNNIFYYKKENGGLSSAKNEGIKHIEGKYVNFFDGDDTLPLNTLREVYNFFEKNNRYIDMVALPLIFFESQQGLHLKYRKMGDKNHIINLLKEPYNFILSSASSFYKKEIFDNFRFNESFVGEEDTELNFKIYRENPLFGYVCERGVQYNYRKRFTQTSLVDTSKEDARSYDTVVRLLDSIIPKTGTLNRLYQEIIIYELRSRIKNIREELFNTKKEYDHILDCFIKYIKRLSPDYIIYDSEFCSTLELKYTFLTLGEFNLSAFNEYLTFSNSIILREIKTNKNMLQLDVTFSNYGNDNIDIVLLNGNSIIEPTDINDFNSALDASVGDFIADKTNLRRFYVKLSKAKILKFITVDKKTNKYYPIASLRVGNRTPFNSINTYYFVDRYRIYYTGVRLKVSKLSKPKLVYLKRLVLSLPTIYNKTKVIPWIRLRSHLNKKYILISDRLTKAGDNGEALFKYINEYRKDLAKLTYYVISKDTPDYERMKQYGKVVATGSKKHKKLFLNAAYIYSSHTMPEFYNAFNNEELPLYRDLFNYKFIWLQHGITQNDISKAANHYLKKIDYVICATNDEYNEFDQEKYCFEKDQIILSGFARYDYLNNHPKNIITLSPTWRRGYGSNTTRTDFTSTTYYHEYSNLLSNKDLIKKLKEHNYIMQFILHPEMLKYIEDFTKYENEVIKIVQPDQINYSQMFAESKLLITDYSSILFDFAYLKKPEILFQFDRDDYYKYHYKRGYFNYDKDGFGPVITKGDEVVKKIIEYIDNDFKVEKEYLKRIEKTFKFIDKNNCKRIIDLTYNKE